MLTYQIKRQVPTGRRVQYVELILKQGTSRRQASFICPRNIDLNSRIQSRLQELWNQGTPLTKGTWKAYQYQIYRRHLRENLLGLATATDPKSAADLPQQLPDPLQAELQAWKDAVQFPTLDSVTRLVLLQQWYLSRLLLTTPREDIENG